MDETYMIWNRLKTLLFIFLVLFSSLFVEIEENESPSTFSVFENLDSYQDISENYLFFRESRFSEETSVHIFSFFLPFQTFISFLNLDECSLFFQKLLRPEKLSLPPPIFLA